MCEYGGSARQFFASDPFLDRRAAKSPQLANMNAANQAAPGVFLESFWVYSNDGCSLLAVDEAFWNFRFRVTFWRSQIPPVGTGLRVHSLTSCGYAERQGFPSAPFRYRASDDAFLSNNFLEVRDNFLGLATRFDQIPPGNQSGGTRGEGAHEMTIM